ncbi:MAG: rod shape-determining protein RodA [Caulobacter sp.]|nr:rod shape-determining protein RodA [Caulobacter sp.]
MTLSGGLSRPGERDRPIIKFMEIDWTLCLVLALIAGAGALMLFSIAGASWEPWADKHLLRFGIYFVMMIILAMVDLRVWFTMAYPIYGIALLLLVAVELVGDVSLGAQRWLQLGPVRFQPSEIMKIGVVLALARYYHGLSADSARLSWKLLIPAGLIGVPTLLVAHQPDLGTAVLIALPGLAVMVLAGLSLRLIIAGIVAGLAALPPFIFFVLHDYQRNRILTFMDPEKDPSGNGYHIMQSKIALGSGGLLGKGFGLGSQSQLNFLPEKQTDFIFATLAEEFGFVGCVSVLFLYGVAIFMALRIASISHSHFGRLAAAGVTATFALYVLINGAMVMGMAPVVGVPMPMLSYGGTVMLTVMVGFGLVQAVRVHRYTEVTSGKGSLM